MTTKNTINIHRTVKDGTIPYFCINRDIAQNRDLSFAARGMLAYILSKPDTWEINMSDLQQQCGRDAARATLNELISAGYIVPGTQSRVKGRFTTATPYQCYESPLTEKSSTVTPNTGKPKTGTQNTVKPSNIVNLDEPPHPEPPRTGQPCTVNPTEDSKEVKKVKTKKVKKKDITPTTEFQTDKSRWKKLGIQQQRTAVVAVYAFGVPREEIYNSKQWDAITKQESVAKRSGKLASQYITIFEANSVDNPLDIQTFIDFCKHFTDKCGENFRIPQDKSKIQKHVKEWQTILYPVGLTKADIEDRKRIDEQRKTQVWRATL